MNEELKFHLRSLTRFIYFVTEEEDRFLLDIEKTLGPLKKAATFVYNAAFGLQALKGLADDWKSREHKVDTNTTNINEALIKVYKDDPRELQFYYVITDPDRYLTDPHVVRRLLNIAHQLHNNNEIIKVIIFAGPRLVIPQKLQRYIEVVHDKGLTDDQLQDTVSEICKQLTIAPTANIAKTFKGLNSWEVDAAIAQSVILNRVPGNSEKRIDAKHIAEFKRRQLKKTDLVSYIDTSEWGFDRVGGADRFKAWANKTKAAWTDAGQKFGLVPPKGVLLAGLWGCGKSISVKALGNAWKLPVVQLEMGKLRSSGVGDSEANTYRVLNLIESVAPCILWIDEAEKSLSGSASSSHSDSGTTSRMIGILSTWMQETKARVCTAMTANTLKNLPTEFVNRMNERFFFDLPAEEERVDILKIHLKAKGQDPTRYNLASLSEAAKNMVGREIEQAIEAAMTESFDANKEGLDGEILENELQQKPRIFKTMSDEIRELTDWVGYDDEVNDGIRARFASSERISLYRQNKA